MNLRGIERIVLLIQWNNKKEIKLLLKVILKLIINTENIRNDTMELTSPSGKILDLKRNWYNMPKLIISIKLHSYFVSIHLILIQYEKHEKVLSWSVEHNMSYKKDCYIIDWKYSIQSYICTAPFMKQTKLIHPWVIQTQIYINLIHHYVIQTYL